jgi:tetratricopeptide (TPR) repeat protein
MMKERWNRLVVILLLGLLVSQGLLSMRQKSATFDEVPHLGHGYFYLLTGELRIITPVVNILAALPLLFLGYRTFVIPQDFSIQKDDFERWGYVFGDRLLYHSNYDSDWVLFLGRLPILLISMIGGIFVFKWAKELYGSRSGIFALFLYAFSPNILAHSRLITHDLGVSVFILIALYQFWKLRDRVTMGNLILSGVSLGLALSSKPTAVVLLPLYFLYTFSIPISSSTIGVSTKFFTNKRGGYILSFIIILLIFVIALYVFILSHGLNLGCIRNYLMSLFDLSGQIQGRPSFLMGKTGRGWYHYFLVAFLIKTPIPTIIFILMSIIFFKKIRNKRLSDEFLLIIPILTIFGVASYSRFNLGLRHILPIYPLLFVFVSKVANLRFHRSNGVLSFLIFILCWWYLVSSLKIYPHYLAYFNEFIGGPENGYKYLVDSNLDWGQDLKGLKRWMEREEIKEIYLAYFGVASRDYYGIKYQYLPSLGSGLYRGYTLPLDLDREILAISATTLQGVYSPGRRDEYSWLRNYKPIANIGYSIFIYDITNDLFAHKRLAEIYMDYYLAPLIKETIREYRKIIKIDPRDPWAHKELAKAYAKAGLYNKAIEECQKALKLDPTIYQAYRILGLVYIDMDKKDEAIASFRKLLEINPKDEIARRALEKLGAKCPNS